MSEQEQGWAEVAGHNVPACGACEGWAKWHMARCPVSPNGRRALTWGPVDAPTVNRDATGSRATPDRSPLHSPVTADTPQTVTVDHWAISRLTDAHARKARP